MIPKKATNFILPAILLLLLVLSFFFFFRIDLTSDKRYSIAPQTKQLMKKVTEPMEVTVYLDGDLNSGFLRLKNATSELLEELSVYSKQEMTIQYVNPSLAESSQKRESKYKELEERDMSRIAIYETDKEGNLKEKIVFPWLEISYKDRTFTVNLLKNIRNNSGEENLNISIENLEYEITDAIRRLTMTKIQKIAFIEGHGELSEQETFDISTSLSRHFQIDRGVLANDASILDDYKVIIIAKPAEKFSETDKYIIDQYVMNGGSILWLLDGVRIDPNSLSATGTSPAIELELNLNDILFKYGVRINPVILQDIQSVEIPVNIAPLNQEPQFKPAPWIYAPLLLTSYNHPITKNLTEVKSDFCSSIELVGNQERTKPYLLLATSNNTHIMSTPGIIDVSDFSSTINDPAYFNAQYVPVGVLLEGTFESVFSNRMTPKDMITYKPTKKESIATRQIIIADGDIIRNEVTKDNETLPLGYDKYMQQQFGNKDFILNAVLYLADNDGWLDLRARTVKLTLLNKKIIQQDRTLWQFINVCIPIGVLLIFGFIYHILRKRKYTRSVLK